MDYMPEGSMHDYIKGARLAGGSSLPPVDRLRIAIHIAGSVADLHTIDGTPTPSFFHNDLCCHQYLFQDGLFKLNDFNYARPIYRRKDTHEPCPRTNFHMQYWKARSLEEGAGRVRREAYSNPRRRNTRSWKESVQAARDGKFTPVLPDKIDVWMMGNLIYYILTDLYLFEEPRLLGSLQAARTLVAGGRSPLPANIRNSTDASHVALRGALDLCWTQRWTERPSARSIADYLLGALRNITGEEEPDLRVTLPERDPEQRHTESDFKSFGDNDD